MLMFSTFVTAATMYYVLGFQSEYNEMTWMACILFGAIISATDPVAVVALLKELGVSVKISTLIEGESLLNDGTALVLFIVLQKMASGEEKTAGDIASMFCQMSKPIPRAPSRLGSSGGKNKGGAVAVVVPWALVGSIRKQKPSAVPFMRKSNSMLRVEAAPMSARSKWMLLFVLPVPL